MSEPHDHEPHDHPSRRERPRIYVALTNACNRACPWCSTYSGPGGNSFISLDKMVAAWPLAGAFDVQLEGGEPLLHPQFWDIVSLVREHQRAHGIVLCTNGVLVPRAEPQLSRWLERLGRPTLVKLSVNHHLLARDRRLLQLARQLVTHGVDLVLNVRRRKGSEGDDAWVMERVREAGLEGIANDFFLQRYGRASGEEGWDEPFAVRAAFLMQNPDGALFDGDLVGRSEAMGRLP